jgi:hypothetical protein
MSDPVSEASVTTEISYCPHLDVYEYKRVDGVYRFDTKELEKTVNLYIDQGKTRDADFMAVLTAMARKYPHKRVKFGEDGTCNVTTLEALPLPEEAESDSSTSG